MSEALATWRGGYAVLSDLWCSPADVDPADVRIRAHGLLPDLERADPAAAAALKRYLESAVSEEEYVDLFELEPKCALYLGSHVFDEPTTCATASVSDRNGYMIEIAAIYRHLGLVPNGDELSDFLPMMLEFLALTRDADDPVRTKLIAEYILPHLPPIRARLKELGTPYLHLLDVTEQVLRLDADA